jgi:hypothetical protein
MLIEQFCIKIADNGKSFIFNEETGVYLQSYNENGWGSPNPELNQATSSVLTVYLPDTQTYYFGSTGVPINIYPAFPDVLPEKKFNVLSTDLGVGDVVLRDGIYKFDLTTVAGGNTYNATAYYFNTFNLEVQKCRLAAVLTKVCCNFNDPKMALYLDLLKAEELICDLMDMEEYESAAELYQSVKIKLDKINSII